MDDELSGESEQILVQSLKQSRDQNHSQIVSRHLVHLRKHLYPEGETHQVRETHLESDLPQSGLSLHSEVVKWTTVIRLYPFSHRDFTVIVTKA